MSISQDGLEMIMDFEGLRLEAYLDAVRVPTIGYGTTRYPDGRRVSLGDAISEEQAEAFLKFECDRLGRDILKECVVSLNQNQLDALTSFCYNLGLGAFLGSTLLREIKASNFAAASAEFPRWNKGTVSGIRTELRGLTRRRARERQLFDSGTTAVPDSGEIDISPVEKVIAVKLCKDKGVNFVATFDSGGNIVEILELGNLLPDTLLSALRLYPNLRSVDFADDGKGVPPGALVTFSGRAR